MSRRDEQDSADIEWIDDVGAAPEADLVEHRPGPRRWPWYLVLVAVLVAAVVVIRWQAQPQHPLADSTPSPSTTPTTSASPSPAESSLTSIVPLPPPSAPDPAPSLLHLGRPLLAGASGWELFGRGATGVVRIQLSTGDITTTRLPTVESSGPMSFVVGPDRAIVRPLDEVTGYTVPDSGPAVPLPSELNHGGPALAGPDANHVWVPTGTGTGTTMRLVGFDGTPTDTLLGIPVDSSGFVASDGAGYLLFYGTGGVYDIRPGGTHRITTGSLLATGPTRYLAEECDDQYRCQVVVIDRSTGARHRIAAPTNTYTPQSGVISPDGRTAALLRQNGNNPAVVHLLDLTTGVDKATSVTAGQIYYAADGAFVWTPDSRIVFAVDAIGAPMMIDRNTARASGFGTTVLQLEELAFRSGRS